MKKYVKIYFCRYITGMTVFADVTNVISQITVMSTTGMSDCFVVVNTLVTAANSVLFHRYNGVNVTNKMLHL